MIGAYRHILDLLNAAERRRFYLLIGAILTMGLVDVLGVASILPFLAVVANPEVVEQNGALNRLAAWTGSTDPDVFLPRLGFLVFLIVIGGVCVRAATFYALTRFIRMRALSLSVRLLQKYLGQPYGWFLGRNTAHLGKTLLTEVGEVVNGPLSAAMRLLAHAVVVVFMVVLLLAIDPVATLGAGIVLGGSYAAIALYFQKRLGRMGAARVRANQERFQVAQEATGGIKDVKIFNLESDYLERFRKPAWRVADAQAREALIAEMPRFLLEAVAFGGMLLFVLWLLVSREGSIDSVLPVLGAYAFAGVRLFPTMQEMFRALTRLRFGAPALASLHAELTERALIPLEGADVPPIPLRKRLVLKDVVYAFPGAERPSLDGLTLEIEANTTVGLVGATGAGKTTVVDVMLGLLTPRQGEMTVDGTPIVSGNLRGWRKSIGYVPQSIYLTDDTIAANIAFGVKAGELDMAAVERAARIAELHDFVASLPEGYRTRVGERGARLSGGQRQRIGIARALYRDPSVLIFDEATSALDNLTEKAVMDAIRTLGRTKTIVLIAHRLTTVRACDRIFMMENGRVVASGVYEELVKANEAFRAIHQAAG